MGLIQKLKHKSPIAIEDIEKGKDPNARNVKMKATPQPTSTPKSSLAQNMYDAGKALGGAIGGALKRDAKTALRSVKKQK